ncbi:MAG: hypothetical protein U0869_14555 [Chloroflexota bacterium]
MTTPGSAPIRSTTCASGLDKLREQALYRPPVVMHGAQAPETTMNGRPVISLSSNNYLGLKDPPAFRPEGARGGP